LPDSCKCVDSQTLKLQETPENVPNGEIPRHIQLYMDRYLCDKAVPGNRITITGIYSIKKIFNSGKVKFFFFFFKDKVLFFELIENGQR
jgi:DNA replication licensing factor MCM5